MSSFCVGNCCRSPDFLLRKVVARGSIIRYFSLRQRLHMPIYFVKGARVAYTNHSLSDVGRQLGALLVFVQGVVPVASRGDKRCQCHLFQNRQSLLVLSSFLYHRPGIHQGVLALCLLCLYIHPCHWQDVTLVTLGLHDSFKAFSRNDKIESPSP